MKAVLVHSSHRLKGNTAAVLEACAGALASLGVEVETVPIARLDLGSCRGCRACFDRGEETCPLHDGALELWSAMLVADLVILGSPTYVEDVNGVMKTLIDRLAFMSHRPALYRHWGFVLVTSGAGATSHGLRTMEKALLTWGARLGGKARYRLGDPGARSALPARVTEDVRRRMTRLVERARRPRRADFLGLMTFHIQKMYYRAPGTPRDRDYDYWEGKGWLDPACRYYEAVPFGAMSGVLSRALGTIIGKLVLR